MRGRRTLTVLIAVKLMFCRSKEYSTILKNMLKKTFYFDLQLQRFIEFFLTHLFLFANKHGSYCAQNEYWTWKFVYYHKQHIQRNIGQRNTPKHYLNYLCKTILLANIKYNLRLRMDINTYIHTNPYYSFYFQTHKYNWSTPHSIPNQNMKKCSNLLLFTVHFIESEQK